MGSAWFTMKFRWVERNINVFEPFLKRNENIFNIIHYTLKVNKFNYHKLTILSHLSLLIIICTCAKIR